MPLEVKVCAIEISQSVCGQIADTLAAGLHDRRDPSRTLHGYASMIRSRMFAIDCGYDDCDDLDELRCDPAFKMACERLPDTGHALASQPTLSRLENTPSWRELARMGLALIDLFCTSFRTVPGHIVLDIDDTSDRTHGGQQLSLFNTHAGGYCFRVLDTGCPQNLKGDDNPDDRSKNTKERRNRNHRI